MKKEDVPGVQRTLSNTQTQVRCYCRLFLQSFCLTKQTICRLKNVYYTKLVSALQSKDRRRTAPSCPVQSEGFQKNDSYIPSVHTNKVASPYQGLEVDLI